MREHDVEREQGRVGEGQPEAQQGSVQPDDGEEIYPGHGQPEGGAVAPRAQTERREQDHR